MTLRAIFQIIFPPEPVTDRTRMTKSIAFKNFLKIQDEHWHVDYRRCRSVCADAD